MNNNFKNFLKEKKDLLIFMGVLIITFISVISLSIDYITNLDIYK